MTYIVLGQLFHACQHILEEIILKSADGQEPCYMLGWEGVFGLIITILVLLIAQFVVCAFREDQCVNGYMDEVH